MPAVSSIGIDPATRGLDQSPDRSGEVAGTAANEYYELTNGEGDAAQIIGFINQQTGLYAANEIVRNFALSLLPRGLRPDDQEAQLNAIASFVRDRVVYVRDPQGIEYICSPVQMLQQYATYGQAYGDCDDHVLLFNSLMASLGFTVRVSAVRAFSADKPDHVISGFKLRGLWYDFDGCNPVDPFRPYPGPRTSAQFGK